MAGLRSEIDLYEQSAAVFFFTDVSQLDEPVPVISETIQVNTITKG